MAERPAPKPAVNDWQPVQASDWQDVNGAPASAQSADGGSFLENALPHALMHPEDTQRPSLGQAVVNGLAGPALPAIEGLYQGAKRSGGELMHAFHDVTHGNPAGAAVHGVNAIPFVGPAMVNAAEKPDVGGTGSYGGDLKSVWESPSAMGTLASGAAQAAPAVLGGLDMAAGAERPMVGQIPSTARAGARINDIEAKAANTPVNFQNTQPALQKFGEHVATGGKGADVMTKLDNRIPEGPMNFPEGRGFYKNVSDVTRRPGFLRRAFEDPQEPQFRYAAGPVRGALNADLTSTLKPLGLDEDYTAALKEYARGSALKTGLKRAAIAGAGAAAGATGLGKVHGIASSVLR